ncbi:MAG TPA: hypothetical protein VN151_11405 [Terracidiphilus sp.]|nr:hypothetical protein [Terracidiphilus sp.]
MGTTGPMGSGLPQFGFPRRFAIDEMSLRQEWIDELPWTAAGGSTADPGLLQAFILRIFPPKINRKQGIFYRLVNVFTISKFADIKLYLSSTYLTGKTAETAEGAARKRCKTSRKKAMLRGITTMTTLPQLASALATIAGLASGGAIRSASLPAVLVNFTVGIESLPTGNRAASQS